MKTIKLSELHKERSVYFRVTPESSKIVQKQLIREGLVWGDKKTSPAYLDEPVIGIYRDGALVYFEDFVISVLTAENIKELDYVEVRIDYDLPTVTLHYMETCLPDFHAGHHLPVVQVSVTSKTTYSDLRVSLLDYTAYEHIEDLDDGEYKKAVFEYFTSLETFGIYLNDVVETCKGIEEAKEGDEYGCDSVYCYFVLSRGEL